MNPSLSIIEKSIRESIISELDKIGLLYRVFSRSKDQNSVVDKIDRKIKDGKPYSVNGKKMQDVIGIRIVTYFRDDIEIAKKIINDKLEIVDKEIDNLDSTVFKPKRTNIICRFNSENTNTFEELQKIDSSNSFWNLIDNTFELQLRTILSEGWHEIDHSLRYKCKDDWSNYNESERMLNGIYASLETNDIALKNLFQELAYQHFKTKNWEALIRNKFRLKFQLKPLKEDIKLALDKNPDVGKQILKINRNEVLNKISNLENSFPVNLNNTVFLINELFIKDEKIEKLTPGLIKDYTQQSA
ncbi:hypothetical protein [Aquimarina sp. MMG016]|uniref:hypothetical protein n=1 Tax=Aquimarina sp. MMG016 TaxID=2822690 RepID=UPI001B3A131D|nr:hypothetical protein [Aquimarina sp. MMG016]MBQ4821516.1 hypothetical protein [Aquimarina sp. MMG016]